MVSATVRVGDGIMALIRGAPVDRLALLCLLSSLYFMQIWALVESDVLPREFRYLMIAISFGGIVVPRASWVLLINAVAFSLFFIFHSPIASNNQTTAFAFSLVVATTLLSRGWLSHSDEDRNTLFRAIAGPGRWILAFLYLYGIYHKINVDFLDSEVSCAVALYATIAKFVGLADWSVGHYGAIYATFVVEGIAMIALFIPRLKWLGFSIGIPFHVFIGFTGYAYYKEFSTIVLVLYMLFMTRSAFDQAVERLVNAVGGTSVAIWCGRLILLAFVAAYFVSVMPTGYRPTTYGFMPFFAVYAVLFYVFALYAVAGSAEPEPSYRFSFSYLVPLAFLVNGFMPYLGSRTEGTIAMYSNLHVEGGVTNHLIHGVLPGTFGYTADLVKPISVNDEKYNWLLEKDESYVRYHFDQILAEASHLVVEVQTQDGVVSTGNDWSNTYLQTPLFLRKYLIFKPVDFERPKVCTH